MRFIYLSKLFYKYIFVPKQMSWEPSVWGPTWIQISICRQILPEVRNLKFKLRKIRLAVATLPEILIGARYDAMTRDKGRRQRLHLPL